MVYLCKGYLFGDAILWEAEEVTEYDNWLEREQPELNVAKAAHDERHGVEVFVRETNRARAIGEAKACYQQATCAVNRGDTR